MSLTGRKPGQTLGAKAAVLLNVSCNVRDLQSQVLASSQVAHMQLHSSKSVPIVWDEGEGAAQALVAAAGGRDNAPAL